MNLSFIVIILIIGISGIAAQVLILRELLVSFYGNELTIGIILSNWIIAEALGAFIFGKNIDKVRQKINLFILLQLAFSLSLPCAIYLSRTFKGLLGIRFGELVGLSTIFWASFWIVLPVSFCHGALFSVSCKVYSSFKERLSHPIGKVYTWETIGTIIGGIILTYLFIPFINSFQAAFIILISNLLSCFLFSKIISKPLRYIFISIITLSLLFIFSGGVYHLQRDSISEQWRAQTVIDYTNSVYGNIAVTKSGRQHTFFYNGMPIITAPYPDIAFVQDFGNFPLLFHPAPRKVLVISAGAGGILNEILKHPVQNVDYAELDPEIIGMLKKYPSTLTNRELNDKRVTIIYSDGRYVVKNTQNSYDVILIGISRPSDLISNRLFTKEFFILTQKKLARGGILSFCLPGSLTALSPELRDFNSSILNGLKKAYQYVRVIPGDYNTFIASDSEYIMQVGLDYIRQNIERDSIKANIFVPGYIAYRLNTQLSEWFDQEMKHATRKINRDFMPFALFEMLVIWNRQFSPGFGSLFALWRHLDLVIALLVILLITTILFFLFRRGGGREHFAIAYSIATTGFFGMLITLVLIFSFQVFYGYLYHRLGIFISIFMAGIAAGSTLIIRNISRVKNGLGLFLKFEILIAGFSLLLAWIITAFIPQTTDSTLIFVFLFFLSGALAGGAFTLASKLYSSLKGTIGETAGALYFSDLIGGWVAGIFGSIIFLPILGLFNTCLLVVFLKLSSFFLLETSLSASGKRG